MSIIRTPPVEPPKHREQARSYEEPHAASADQQSCSSNAEPLFALRVLPVAQLQVQLPSNPEQWLSPTELARLPKLRAPKRREHYLAGHWLLRLLLKQTPGIAAELTVLDRPSLPPALLERPDLHISLSHSGPWIAGAISSSAVGIDLEQRQPRPALAGFEQLLRNPDEGAGGLDLDQLLQRWVVKEAFIKRDCGGALPERLAELRLHESELPADVVLLSNRAFILGIAGNLPSDALHEVQGSYSDLRSQHWIVEDLAS